jgi:hypothetical protein
MDELPRLPAFILQLVRGVEPCARFRDDVRDERGVERLSLETLHDRRDGLALEILHDEEELRAFPSELVDLHDVRVTYL